MKNAETKKMREEIKKHLTEGIIPFWKGMRDDEFGGRSGLRLLGLGVWTRLGGVRLDGGFGVLGRLDDAGDVEVGPDGVAALADLVGLVRLEIGRAHV